jgi:hypothetical protein
MYIQIAATEVPLIDQLNRSQNKLKVSGKSAQS